MPYHYIVESWNPVGFVILGSVLESWGIGFVLFMNPASSVLSCFGILGHWFWNPALLLVLESWCRFWNPGPSFGIPASVLESWFWNRLFWFWNPGGSFRILASVLESWRQFWNPGFGIARLPPVPPLPNPIKSTV